VANLIVDNILEPKLKCSILFCEILKLDKAQLFSHMDDEIYEGDFIELSSKVNMLLNNAPIQYVTGHQEFMSLDFLVTSDVLIPRQDTETLVEAVISTLKGLNTVKPRILELGVGSGCIAVSLANYIPTAKIVSTDLSECALSIAHRNASINKVSDRIEFIQGNMLLQTFYTNDLKDTIDLNGMFDVLVSNPPYIPTDDIKHLDHNVSHYEPHIALDGGKDGLDFYTAITAFSQYVLKDNGLIFLEAGFDTILPAADILKKRFQNVQIINDINGINRVLLGSIKKAPHDIESGNYSLVNNFYRNVAQITTSVVIAVKQRVHMWTLCKFYFIKLH